MKSIIIFSVAVAALLSGCSGGEGHGCHAGDGHGESDHGDEIIFTPEQAQAAGLQIEEVQPGEFREVIVAGGQIVAAQGDRATVAATAEGIVSLGRSLAEGAAVKAGETLATISAGKLQGGDPAEKARIACQGARQEWERARALVDEQIMPAREFEQIEMRYRTALAEWEALSSEVTSRGVRLTAPMSGYVTSRLVDQGEYVAVGQPVAVVSQNRRLQLRAEVSQRHFRCLRGVVGANFRTPYDEKLYRLADLNGRLLSSGRAADGGAFYLPVTFEFDNVGDIIPGTPVTIYLLGGVQRGAISVPVSALTEEQGFYFVYLQVDEEGYSKREVTLGASDGQRVRIVAGLQAGERVVTRGAYNVKLAAASTVAPEGHSHAH
ncbi:cation efflux system protein [Bacteroidia bacterium]|nr:cation efflux system protein [Bacteroidia bacterium]